MSPLDPEAERDLQGRRRALGLDTDDEIFTVPGDRRDGNGKKWWSEVWGKVAAGLLLIAIPGLAAWFYFKATAAVAATVELYAMPAAVGGLRTDVDRHSTEIKELQARRMPDADIKKLARQIAQEMKAK